MSYLNAAVLHSPGNIVLEKRGLEPLADEELRIAVTATGLCGSDLHYFKHGRNGDFIVTEPLCLGIVVEVGTKATKDWKTGDRVALEVGLPCEAESCNACNNRRYNICPRLRFKSSAKRVEGHKPLDGTLQGLISHPAKWCHKLPDDVDLDEAALLEPLSVAAHAIKRATLPINAHCLILGAGAIGLLVSALCRAAGAETTLIVDVDPGRIDFALNKGFASHGYVVGKSNPLSTEDKLKEATNLAKLLVDKASVGERGGFDRSFDCTGAEICMQTAIFATISGGSVMPIGMGTPNMYLPIAQAAFREVNIVGVFRYANTYKESIRLLEKEAIPCMKSIITHTYNGLGTSADALTMAGKTRDDEGNLVIKVLIRTAETDHHIVSD